MSARVIKITLIAIQALWLMAAPAIAQGKPANSAPNDLSQVIAAVPREWPPQYDTDENGKPIGFAIDVIESIAARAGFRITYKVFDTFAEINKAIDAGDADIVPNLGDIPERTVRYAFTAPVETFAIVIFVRHDSKDIKSFEDLPKHRVAVVKTNAAVDVIRARTDIDSVIYRRPLEALFELLSGHVDAVIYPGPVLLRLARQAGVEDLIKVVGSPVLEIKRAIGVRRNKPDLFAALDKAVNEFVGTPEYQQIYVKWYGNPAPYWTGKRVAWAMGSLLAGVLLIFAWWRYRLLVRLNRRIAASEEKFRDLIEGAVPGVLIHRDHKPLFVNRSYANIFGYDSPDDLLRQPSALDHVAPHEHDRLKAITKARLQGEKIPTVYEFQGVRKDGTRIWLENRARVVDWEGAPAIQRTVVDITEKRQAEAALMARTRQQAVVAELGQRALRSPNLTGLMNTAVRLLSGLLEVEYCAVLELAPDKDEFVLRAGVGWKPGTVGAATTSAGKASQAAATLSSGDPVVVEDWRTETRFEQAPLLREHGIVSGVSVTIGDADWPYGVLSAHTSVHRVFTEDDILILKTVAIVLASAISRDQVERALSDSEERLRGAIASLQEGFALYDADDRLVMINDQYRAFAPGADEFLAKRMRFEDIVRVHVANGLITDAVGHEEEFIRERLAQHRSLKGPIIRRHSNGKWYVIKETRTGEGGTAVTIGDITSLKQTEEALRDSEQRFRDFAEAASDWFWEMDENLRFTEFGERRKMLMNLPVEASIGKTRWELAGADPDTDPKWRDHRATLEAHQLFRDFEYERADAHGESIVTSVSGKPVFDAAGNFRGYRGTASNITARRRTELALRESEERFRAVIDYSPGVIIIKDLEGRYIITNKAFGSWYRADSKDVIGKVAQEFLPKEIVDSIAAQERKVLDTKSVVEEERRATYPDGITRDVFTQKFPIFGADGNCIAIGTVINDITARKREEQKFRSLLQSAPDAMVIVNDKGQIELINRQAETLFGYKAEELRGREVECLLPSNFRKKHVRHRRNYVASPHARPMGSGVELRGVAKDGRMFPVEVSLGPIPTEDGLLVAAAIKDISARKASEKKMSEMQIELAHVSRISTMGEMAAGLAHELNQPLTAIANYAKGTMRRMKSGQGNPANLLPVLELVAEQALRAGEIIRKVRGFMTRSEPKKSWIDLGITINEAITLMAGEINLAGIEVVVDVPGSLPSVMADSIQIQQVLVNLIRNAVAMTNDEVVDNRRLEIGAAVTDGNAIEVYVKDDGPGIPADISERLFDPFFTTKTDGLGMGLSISRTIINGHNGRIWVSSEAGKGATVHFTLPIEEKVVENAPA